jgi:hypothetical protein
MFTHSHSFFTWLLAKHGVKAGQAAGIAGAAGAALPDVPAFAGEAYFWNQRDSIPREEQLNAVYFTGFFGGTGSVLHSLVPPAALLLAYRPLRIGRVDRRRILLWFLLGWAGHTVVDFLTHVNDTRPLFWPISGWEWSSPVSYYDPRYHGVTFNLVCHGTMLVSVLLLSLRRLRMRRCGIG